MPKIVKVVLYGSSLFIAGLLVSLSELQNLEIQHVEAKTENDLERVCIAKPDVIIVELGIASNNLTVTLLQKFPGVTLIGLDPESDRLLVLSVREQTALVVDDLVWVMTAAHRLEGGEP